MICSRTACNREATSGEHPDIPGNRYCPRCRRAINQAVGTELIPLQPSRDIMLPIDFGVDTRLKMANCPFVLTDATADCDIKPGTVVYGSNSGIEMIFPPNQRIRMVLVGFTKPHGYACCIDRNGEWWNTHPEALEATP